MNASLGKRGWGWIAVLWHVYIFEKIYLKSNLAAIKSNILQEGKSNPQIDIFGKELYIIQSIAQELNRRYFSSSSLCHSKQNWSVFSVNQNWFRCLVSKLEHHFLLMVNGLVVWSVWNPISAFLFSQLGAFTEDIL